MVAEIKDEKWSNEKVCQMFDANLNATLAELSRVSGHSIAELKRILIKNESN